MISISAFIISLSGIVSLLYFRLWEIKRGERLFDSKRGNLDNKVVSLSKYIKDHMPTLDRAIVPRMYHAVIHYFALIVLNVVKVIERHMVSLLEHVRGKREVRRGVTQSDFLRQVRSHKQSLEKPMEDGIK